MLTNQSQTERLTKKYQALLNDTPKNVLDEWARHPGTQIILAYLEASYETIKESWANGAFTQESMEATCQKNAEQIGKVDGILELVEVINTLGDKEL